MANPTVVPTREYYAPTEPAGAPSSGAVPQVVQYGGGPVVSEKTPVAEQQTAPSIPSEPARKQSYWSYLDWGGKLAIVAGSIVILAALILGLVFGLGFRRSRGSGGMDENPNTQGTNSLYTSTGSSSTTDSAGGYPFGSDVPTTAGVFPTTDIFSTTAGSTTPTAVARPSFSLGSFSVQTITLTLAASSGGLPTATTTLTVPYATEEPIPGGPVTAPVFHSSAFSPAAYASTLTYTAARLGDRSGLGVVDCPAANNGLYITSDRAVFRKTCYSDVGQAPNVGSTVVASLGQCIEACMRSAAATGLRARDCPAVSYGANITLALIDQQANCWFKSTFGVATPGDWQQSIATFLGFAVS